MALVTPQVNHTGPKQPSFVLSQPPSDARFSGACASRCPPANFSTNTPTDEGDVPALASVTVEDPHREHSKSWGADGVGLGSGLTGRGWAGAETGVAGEAGCGAAAWGGDGDRGSSYRAR